MQSTYAAWKNIFRNIDEVDAYFQLHEVDDRGRMTFLYSISNFGPNERGAIEHVLAEMGINDVQWLEPTPGTNLHRLAFPAAQIFHLMDAIEGRDLAEGTYTATESAGMDNDWLADFVLSEEPLQQEHMTPAEVQRENEAMLFVDAWPELPERQELRDHLYQPYEPPIHASRHLPIGAVDDPGHEFKQAQAALVALGVPKEHIAYVAVNDTVECRNVLSILVSEAAYDQCVAPNIELWGPFQRGETTEPPEQSLRFGAQQSTEIPANDADRNPAGEQRENRR